MPSPSRQITFLLLLLLTFGCRPSEDVPVHRITRFAMGTMVEYTIAGATNSAARQAVEASHRELERVSSLLWEDDSLSATYRINRSTDSAYVGPEVLSFMKRSRQYSEETRGAFDVTIKPVLSLYDFDADNPVPPAAEDIIARLKWVGMDGFSIDDAGFIVKKWAESAIAVGGVAKGYGVDRAVAVIRDLGIKSAVVNAGGDLYCLGTNGRRPWRVGVRDPDDPNSVIQVLHVTDAAVATSGDYQQFFEHDGIRYHHILDPSDGRPARGVRSATVIAPTTETADALATAAFVLGPREGVRLMQDAGVEGILVDSTGRMHMSPGIARYVEPGTDRTPARTYISDG